MSEQVSGKQELSVFSYNILSEKLCSFAWFGHCKEEDCDPDTRWERILEKVQYVIENKGVLCLQEIPMARTGALHVLFEKHNYHFIHSLYGNDFNGYMGIGLAFPRDIYSLDDSLINQPTLAKEWPKERVAKPNFIVSAFQSLLNAVKTTFLAWYELLPLVPSLRSRDPVDVWAMAKKRWNTMVQVRLGIKESDKQVCVATYHMPCAFRYPEVMMIHTSLAITNAKNFAGDTPLIVAGDWNFKPDSPMYAMVTTGEVDTTAEGYPKARLHDAWLPSVPLAMRSAYQVALGAEPDFTNYAQRTDAEEPFIETLDYLFVSDAIQVNKVHELASREHHQGPFPTEKEPSDHILVGMYFSLD